MRGFVGFTVITVLAAVAAPADAGLAKKCKKACKPIVAECVGFTGQSKRACKKMILPSCKREGLGFCTLTTTTTTPGDGPTGSTNTTTTLPGDGGDGGGVMYLDVNGATFTGDQDPRLYTISISIEYGVVTSNAATQVSLDAAHFSVFDEDTEATYPAEPAAAPEDCSSDDVIELGGPAVTCTLHFLMPRSVGELSQVQGGVHSQVRFDALGFHASEYFTLD